MIEFTQNKMIMKLNQEKSRKKKILQKSQSFSKIFVKGLRCDL